ncbi:MAG TPA: trehalose-phosphatase [candidate division Zixibacteria bacterium]
MTMSPPDHPVPFDFGGFESVQNHAHRVLMLDYDGTLAPFRAERMAAVPYEGVRERLDAISTRPESRLVIVSGRPVTEVVALLDVRFPIEIWGAHGWQRQHADGKIEEWSPPGSVRDVLQRALASVPSRIPRDALESKTASVALHTRRLPPAEGQRCIEVLYPIWERLVDGTPLQLRRFDGGIEVRSMARSKGDAVSTLKAECRPDAFFAYLGDDETDEDAFARLSTTDWAILVRPEVRPSRARYWLRPPGELLDFLAGWTRDR